VPAFLAAGARAQLVKRETLLVIVKPLDAIVTPLRHGQASIEELERRHVPALRELNRERGDRDGDVRFAADLDAGYRGFAGFRGEQLASCYWWCDGRMPPHRDMRELGLGIELRDGDVYGYHLYVHKDHRPGGTVNDFLFQVERALHERGYEPRWTVERTRVLRRWSNRIVRRDARVSVAA